MKKIDRSNGPLGKRNKLGKKSKKSYSNKTENRYKSNPTSFGSYVENAGKSHNLSFVRQPFLEENILENLMDNLHTHGENLKDEQSLSNIKEYKQAVREFVHYIVANSLEVEEKISGVNILKRKKYTVIHIIDNKLDSLASGVLQNQLTQLEILKRIDEIHGLLVDLTR